METENFMKEFKTIRDKALKYDSMRSRYIVIAQRLQKVSSELDSISKEIDPLVNMKHSDEIKPRVSFKDAAKELYEKCMAGTEISRKFIEVAYPDYNSDQHGYILNMISKMKNVDKRRDGMNIYLFAKNETLRNK